MIRRETEITAKKFNRLEGETAHDRGGGALTKALMTYDSNLREARDTYSGLICIFSAYSVL